MFGFTCGAVVGFVVGAMVESKTPVFKTILSPFFDSTKQKVEDIIKEQKNKKQD
jgi:hypothetical protein